MTEPHTKMTGPLEAQVRSRLAGTVALLCRRGGGGLRGAVPAGSRGARNPVSTGSGGVVTKPTSDSNSCLPGTGENERMTNTADSKSPTPPGPRVQTRAHTINPTSGPALNTRTTTEQPRGFERGALVASGWSEVAQALADPATAAAVAGASASVANTVIRETAATIRQGMSEKTNRRAGAPSSGPTASSSDGGQA